MNTPRKKAALHNLGCKVNAYEMDAMTELLENSGYEIVPFEERADIYIINTCTVTNIADRKSRQMLHRAKKQNPDGLVVAVGCYVQTHQEELQKELGVDLCIGNNQKGRLVEILESYLEEGRFWVEDIALEKNYEELKASKTAERCRAFIKIQDGCNQFCSYCMIPHARGRVRSRQEENILAEIQKMTEAGYQEFVLTGIHLSSYGTDFSGEKPRADLFGEKYLLALIERIHELEGVKRIRLGSLEPRIITEEFVRRLQALPKVCPHFHLSLQSGCDETLKRMNRHYTAADFKERTRLLRSAYEHPAITTDVIVGFPGETEEEFAITKSFLEDIQFFEMHIFKYSKRKNTPAATMPGQLTDQQKAKRSDILEQLQIKHSTEFRSFYVGKTVEVLFEERKQIGGASYWVGHTPEYVRVVCPEEAFANAPLNQIRQVQVEAVLESQCLLAKC